jgi:hypothetical protein
LIELWRAEAQEGEILADFTSRRELDRLGENDLYTSVANAKNHGSQ